MGCRVFDRFEAQRGCRVKSGAKCGFVDEAQIARLRIQVGRHNANAPDMNRAPAQDPHRFIVAADRRRDRDIGDAERMRDLVRRDAIGHQGRDPAVLRDLGVDGAKVHESKERIIAGMVEVDTVRHAQSVTCRPSGAVD